jgi:hypothetical protein
MGHTGGASFLDFTRALIAFSCIVDAFVVKSASKSEAEKSILKRETYRLLLLIELKDCEARIVICVGDCICKDGVWYVCMHVCILNVCAMFCAISIVYTYRQLHCQQRSKPGQIVHGGPNCLHGWFRCPLAFRVGLMQNLREGILMTPAKSLFVEREIWHSRAASRLRMGLPPSGKKPKRTSFSPCRFSASAQSRPVGSSKHPKY